VHFRLAVPEDYDGGGVVVFAFYLFHACSRFRGLDAAGDVGLYAARITAQRIILAGGIALADRSIPGPLRSLLEGAAHLVEDLQIINRRSSLRHAKTALAPLKLARSPEPFYVRDHSNPRCKRFLKSSGAYANATRRSLRSSSENLEAASSRAFRSTGHGSPFHVTIKRFAFRGNLLHEFSSPIGDRNRHRVRERHIYANRLPQL